MKYDEVTIGNSYTLQCNHSFTTDIYEVVWKYDNGTSSDVVASQRFGENITYGSGYSIEKVELTFPAGDLLLKSFSCYDEKQYRCTFKEIPPTVERLANIYNLSSIGKFQSLILIHGCGRGTILN